jgi:beta-lactamase regulating signal transducer with metallopeptidase domain
MGAFTLYAIKSALCLAVLYLPFTLLLRRETFFAFNRIGLLLIIGLSLVVPCLNIPLWDFSLDGLLEQQRQAVIEVGMPAIVAGEKTAVAHQEATDGSGWNWAYLLVYTYLIGMVVCLVIKGRQLYRLLRFIPSGCLWTDRHDGVTIYCHAGELGAFSWMRSIVVGEADSAPDSPVMLHEMAHVRHGHSWDALLVAFVEVLQWFNPCIWMLDISLREIHEYEADDAVLRRGITARNYQLLLIKNAVRGSRYAFANAFNHSLLKKRITMMMRKKSSKWARMRLLYIIPATMIVLGAFASHRFVSQATSLGDVGGSPTSHADVVEPSAPPKAAVVEKSNFKEKEDVGNVEQESAIPDVKPETSDVQMPISTLPDTGVVKTVNGKQVYDVPEVMPEFPGGQVSLLTYVSQNFRYPQIAYENGVQGRYVVGFCISSEGKVTDVEIARKPEGETLSEINVNALSQEDDSVAVNKRINQVKAREALEQEAIRLVKSLPDWKPGMVDGKPVNCRYNMPVTFKLQ